MSRCREIQISGHIKMFHGKEGDACTSKPRVGSFRLLLKMTPIREAAEKLADLPFGQV